MNTPLRSSIATLVVVITWSLAAALHGQCEPQWSQGDPAPTPHGRVAAVLPWDPDGAGPSPTVLVAAGRFTVADTANVGVATWSNGQWIPFPVQPTLDVRVAIVYAGQLTLASRNRVDRWNGSAWQTIGTLSGSTNNSVNAMTTFNGDLIVGGRFGLANGAPATNIARWNGSGWSGLGSGVYSIPSGGDEVFALATYTYNLQDALFVGGHFWYAGGLSAQHVAVWTGSAWSVPFGANGDVLTMATRISTSPSTSYLFLGGRFTSLGSVPVDRVARYASWTNTLSAMSTWVGTEPCARLFVRSVGASSYELVAAQASQLWRWTGSAWNTLGADLAQVQGQTGSGNILAPRIESIAYFGGRYVLGLADYFGLLGGTYDFDGVTWNPLLSTGIADVVLAVLPVGNEFVIGGKFRSISGVSMNGVAIGTPGNWRSLGSGVGGGNGTVYTLARLPNGDVVAGGSFTVADGAPSNHIARWDGVAWQPMAGGMNAAVFALLTLPTGELVAGGTFSLAGSTGAQYVARWNGSYWSDLAGGLSSPVWSLTAVSNGGFVAGGSFTAAGGQAQPANRVARWDGGAWQVMGSGMNAVVRGLTTMPNGDIVACGEFTTADGQPVEKIARWDGTGWRALPAGMTSTRVHHAVLGLPNGDLLVGGDLFTVPSSLGGQSWDVAARLRGSTWEALRVGEITISTTADSVRAFAMTSVGDVVVAGDFFRVSNVVSARFARLAPTCPASAVAYGSGCGGSGGIDTLTASSLPWIGARYRAHATGLPSIGMCASILGVTPTAIPISSILPQGLPGCALLTTAELLDAVIPNGGTVDVELQLPVAASLVGVPIRHQIVSVELSPGGQIAAVTSSNGLTLTFGAL